MRPLGKETAEFRRVEHLLGLYCAKYELADVSIEEIDSPVFRVEYDRRSRDLASVECFSSPIELGFDSLEKVETEGLKFGDENPMFGVGEVELDLPEDGARPLRHRPPRVSRQR